MPWNPYTGRMEIGQNYGGFYSQQGYNPAQLPAQQVIRVNGTEGAKALQMSPNSSVFAADETDPNRIFLCITDGAGFKTVRPIRGTFEDLEPKQPGQLEDRLTALENRIKELEARAHDRVNSGGADAPAKRRSSADRAED